MTGPFVIIGGGLAGAKTAEGLRVQGWAEPIVLICGEQHLPYERPPLSKGYLAGTDDRGSLDVHDREWYADPEIELFLGSPAMRLDRNRHEVTLGDETRIGYDQLVLATGSRPRKLDLPGSDADGVFYLREVDDSDALGTALGKAERITIIGGGWIGLEVAATARQRGVEVDVAEMARLPLLGVLGEELAQMFADLHRDHGVRFHFNAIVTGIEVQGRQAIGVSLADGTSLPADFVVVGVGAIPNVELAQQAGLETDNGVLVDEYLRTSDPDVYAVGDIAAHAHPTYGRLRVEHWANALSQPAAVAATTTGTLTPYTKEPFFYTDQYDLGMEYRGFVPADVEPTVVIRGDTSSRQLVTFWLSPDNHVLAGMNVNIWDVGDHIAALLGAGPVDPKRLADPGVPLDRLCP